MMSRTDCSGFFELQINEIEKAQLVSGEEQELMVKRQRIRNANRFNEGVIDTQYSVPG